MPVPPPPPPPPAAPPPPPPPPSFSKGQAATPKLNQGDSGGRSALLSDIHKGARLKKVTQINDRSAPQIDGEKKSSSSGNGRGAVAPPSGGLFAGGFPVLKPPGQRDTSGNKSALPVKPGVNTLHTPGLPKRPTSPAPATIAMRAPPPPRPTILGPPPTPSVSSKPQMMLANATISQAYKERSTNHPPLPPFFPQGNKSPKAPRPLSQSFPPPPPPLPSHPPPAPPSGYTGKTDDSYPPPPSTADEFPKTYPSLPERDYPAFPPPPPPPPPLHLSLASKRRLSEPLPPPPPTVLDQSNAPSRPMKNPPALPPPLHGRNVKVTGSNGSRLVPPPPPPIRSPSTELTSRQQTNQNVPHKNSTQQAYPLSKAGSMNHLDDFESKFPFHSVEDFPPPEYYEPIKRLYPSKSIKVRHNPPPPPPLRPQIR
ncbi:hypothetical protein XENTR_v10016178 [Xenopus tropicalis]|uniref:WAS/WASL-interacting protein family member 3 n=1 Tax=Xenopus tropicalis TaxID=8364 RepID=A0A803JIK1_XENTR|nr:WAS/WASL-interacting protein family member 3 [Xenopus tropicalis]XP_031759886.1 WAS/WASL-interacting protein family member 3 [Xenopus tropicalis]KAE8596613.1 hypothetical protein XENTR_v10016178 [Xenopus tropicalis]|eukprot:XP_017950315.1 PREDICTED: WAS/WASL-interacting protein family member 3 [Xenopus tropicalis]